MQNDNTAAQTETDPFLRKFTRELPVSLNDHENQLYGKMLAEKCKEQELAIEKAKQIAADHKNRIKVITNEIKRLADARAKGEELRPVMCGERLHGNVIEIVRLDRGEVVDTRPAELKDLQTSIPGTGMPDMPDNFDEGPRGAGLGTTADQPVEDEGEIVESSVGDEVYVGDTDDHDEETRDVYAGENPEPEEAEQLAAKPESSPMTQREKDVAQRNKEIAESKKPTRERSKAKNGSKGKKK